MGGVIQRLNILVMHEFLLPLKVVKKLNNAVV